MIETISKTIRTRNGEEEVYFKPVTGGQRLRMTRGQKATRDEDGKARIEIDLGDQLERDHLLVHFTCCDASGRSVYPSVQAVQNIDDQRLAKLIAAAREADAEFQAEPGNS